MSGVLVQISTRSPSGSGGRDVSRVLKQSRYVILFGSGGRDVIFNPATSKFSSAFWMRRINSGVSGPCDILKIGNLKGERKGKESKESLGVITLCGGL